MKNEEHVLFLSATEGTVAKVSIAVKYFQKRYYVLKRS